MIIDDIFIGTDIGFLFDYIIGSTSRSIVRGNPFASCQLQPWPAHGLVAEHSQEHVKMSEGEEEHIQHVEVHPLHAVSLQPLQGLPSPPVREIRIDGRYFFFLGMVVVSPLFGVCGCRCIYANLYF